MIVKKRAQIYPAINPVDPDWALMLLPETPTPGHAVTVFVNGVADDEQYEISIDGNKVIASLNIIGSRVYADYMVSERIDLVVAFDAELLRVREARLSGDAEEDFEGVESEESDSGTEIESEVVGGVVASNNSDDEDDSGTAIDEGDI